MSNITPSKPNFTLGYWRPWNENSNLVDSYLDYTKDVSLVNYGADNVGKYIAQASSKQVEAINSVGKNIALASKEQADAIYRVGEINAIASSDQLEATIDGFNMMCQQSEDIKDELNFINRNFQISIEQQKLTNLLLEDISKLLRVPDSEKERQYAIELGIKFFVNAKKDVDLFDDALEELLKAESLMKQDYFVLHRLGLIYMHVQKHINIEKALTYFTKAAKYASVESDPKAMRLINALTGKFNAVNSEATNNTNEIQHLAAESYEKAAFACYVLGQFELAVLNQSKALKYKISAKNYFMLAKYQTRTKDITSCLLNLEKAIDIQPSMAIAVFREIDLMNESEVLLLVENKNKIIVNNIVSLIGEFEKIPSEKSNGVIIELNKTEKKRYDLKVACFEKYTALENDIKNDIKIALFEIENLILLINDADYSFIEEEKIILIEILTSAKDYKLERMQNALLEATQRHNKNIEVNSVNKEIEILIYLIKNTEYTIPKNDLIESLNNVKGSTLEKMQYVLKESWATHNSNRLQIGSNYAGGIVFYIDVTGNHGLVCADNDLRIITTSGEQRISTNVRKAVQLCESLNLNGYNDWFLPNKNELELIHKNKVIIGGLKGIYWSSTETNDDKAYAKNFDYVKSYYNQSSGNVCNAVSKKNENYVRPVRAF